MHRYRSVSLVTAALVASRGLFAQAPAPHRPWVIPVTAEQLRLSLRTPTLALAVPDTTMFPPPEPVRAPDLRLTVDTPDDLAFAQRLAAQLAVTGGDPRLAPLRDVIAAARRLPAREVA